jgi:ABC transport system ATP-binding/permease protein
LKRRTILARELVKEPDILLLDEPTNHLDIKSIMWLENFFGKYNKSLVFVTHDRAFLQAVATWIYELDRGNVRGWNCDYKSFLERRESDLAAEDEQNSLFDKRLAIEEVWIRTGIKARRTRNEGRVRALKKLRNERDQRRDVSSTASFALQENLSSGKQVIVAKDISFSYPDKKILNNFSTVIMRGDKIGILGENGCGKSTLFKNIIKRT